MKWKIPAMISIQMLELFFSLNRFQRKRNWWDFRCLWTNPSLISRSCERGSNIWPIRWKMWRRPCGSARGPWRGPTTKWKPWKWRWPDSSRCLSRTSSSPTANWGKSTWNCSRKGELCWILGEFNVVHYTHDFFAAKLWNFNKAMMIFKHIFPRIFKC